ncbi:hypothetical protein H0H93_016827 [Arthromyces matolae]|nr:hypothetical protein H0H93_016827 [Arthromyces matolae]
MPLLSTLQQFTTHRPDNVRTGAHATNANSVKKPSFHRLKIKVSSFLTSLTHWTGRVWKMRSKRIFTIQELQDLGFQVIDWDGRNPHVFIDDDDRVFVILAGTPALSDREPISSTNESVLDTPTPRRWAHVIRACEHTMCSVLMEGKRRGLFKKSTESHRRGDFHALACGVSFGGGQRKPMNLVQTPKYKALLVKKLLDDVNIQTVAKFQSDSLKAYAPKIHEYQADRLSALYHHDSSLSPNFPNSIYPAATFNLGPASVTAMHIDTANAESLLCAITAFGNYDPIQGGHLVLFDLGAAIVFPPGSTILIPSALLRHGNTQIQEGEMRLSFTQYCAGGLLRWIKHGYRSDKSFRKTYGEEHWRRKLREADGSPDKRKRDGLRSSPLVFTTI